MSDKEDKLNVIRAELKKLEDFQEIEHFSDMVLSIISLSVDLSQVTKQRDEAIELLKRHLCDNPKGSDQYCFCELCKDTRAFIARATS